MTTKTTIALADLVEKGADSDLLRDMIQYVAQRLMELDAEGLCAAAYRERAGPAYLNNCTGSDKWTSLRVRLPGASAANGSRTGRVSHGQGSSAVVGRCRSRDIGAASLAPR